MQKNLLINLKVVFLVSILVGCSTPHLPETPAERLTFENTAVIEVLNDLIQVDIDTYYVYNQAIAGIKEPYIKDIFIAFRADHERHIRTLSTHVLQLGGTPPAFSRDMKGVLMTGYAAIRRATGTEGILKAMQSAEKDSHEIYEKAALIQMSAPIKADIKNNLQDERHHLTTIDQLLSNTRKKLKR